tara:strand:- start:39204 stop:40469 length:1266 start_codon:yes stop_codon:yes gene_type:complete
VINYKRSLIFPLILIYFLFPRHLFAEHEYSFNVERLNRIDSMIDESIKNKEIPGAVGLIMQNGRIIYHKSFGFADVNSKLSMTNDAIFRIASMTKAITSVGVMMLYEEGKLLLSDPVSKFIPEFKGPRVIKILDHQGNITETRVAKREIQIMDLLTHTSGIGYPFIPSKLSKSYAEARIIDGLTADSIVLEDLIVNLASQPLLFDPGTSYAYGLNSDVLGYVIERISGMSLDIFFQKMIFKPLGMHDTYFYLPPNKQERLVTLYADKDGAGIEVSDGTESDIYLDDPNYPINGSKSMYSGGAGLSSTAYDYSRFLMMLLNDGQVDQKSLLSRKSIELMRTARFDTDKDGELDFGLGFDVTNHLKQSTELASVGAYAWGGAFYTTFWVDPEEKLIGVFMSQVRPVHSDTAKKFKNLVYQSLN